MKSMIERIDMRLDTWGEKLSQKNIRYPADLVTGVLFLIFSIVILLIMPQQIAVSEKDVVDGRAFPTLLMYVMMAASAVLILKEGYKVVTKKPLEMKTMNLLVEVKALIIILILIGTYFIAKTTDLFVLGAIFCCLAFLAFFRCKKKSYYIITLALAVAIWAAFRFVLNVNF